MAGRRSFLKSLLAPLGLAALGNDVVKRKTEDGKVSFTIADVLTLEADEGAELWLEMDKFLIYDERPIDHIVVKNLNIRRRNGVVVISG